MNNKEFLCAYRMSRKLFHKMVEELKNYCNFTNLKKEPEKNKEMLQEYLLYFFNFVSTFGDGSVNNRIRLMTEKVSGTHENYHKRIINTVIDNMKYQYFH